MRDVLFHFGLKVPDDQALEQVVDALADALAKLGCEMGDDVTGEDAGMPIWLRRPRDAKGARLRLLEEP